MTLGSDVPPSVEAAGAMADPAQRPSAGPSAASGRRRWPGEALAQFERFSSEQWAAWIRAFLMSPLKASPRVEPGRAELHDVLIGIGRALSRAAYEVFGEGVSQLLASTSKDDRHAAELYYLLEMIAVATPLSAPRMLRQDLEQGAYEGLEFANTGLHSLLLSVTSVYGTDPWLAAYVRRTARVEDLSHFLVCIRVLSYASPREGLSLVLEALEGGRSEFEFLQILDELRGIASRSGVMDLYAWHRDTALKLGKANPDLLRRLENTLRVHVSPWPMAIDSERDEHAVLLAARLHAGYQRFTARQVVRVARAFTVVGREDGKEILREDVKELLRVIWTETELRLSISVPWRYLEYPMAPETESAADLVATVETAPGDVVDLNWASDDLVMKLLQEVTPFQDAEPPIRPGRSN